MKDMVSSLKFSRVFNSDEIIWSFDHTENFLVPTFVLAYSAGIFIGQIKADRTKMNFLFYIKNSSGKFMGFRGTASQDVEGQPRGRLSSNPWKLCQGVNEVVNGFGKCRHSFKLPFLPHNMETTGDGKILHSRR